LGTNANVIDSVGPNERFIGIFGGGSARQYKGTLAFSTKNGTISFSTTLDKHRKR